MEVEAAEEEGSVESDRDDGSDGEHVEESGGSADGGGSVLSGRGAGSGSVCEEK